MKDLTSSQAATDTPAVKTELVDVSQTQKHLVVEIPSVVVDAEIDRVARDYSKAARIPGFRPGKVPARLVRQRFREQILHDVAHGLIPKTVDEALRARGVEPIDTPDIRDVVVEEGQPLKFTASFETVPPIDLGDYGTLRARRPEAQIDEAAVDQALARLRQRAARHEPVDDRGVEAGDTVVVDLERTAVSDTGTPGESEHHDNISIEIGAPANPPGFDEELTGLTPGQTKQFEIRYPDDYTIRELAGTTVQYRVGLTAIKKRVLPDLDDEFAKDVGDFETLEALRARLREDLEHEARHEAERQVRTDVMRQLAGRVPFEVPAALLDREIDRRVEEFVRRLLEQQIDPMRTNINWEEFRERQRDPAAEAVKGALALDEVARRERIEVTEAEVAAELDRYAARSSRSAAAVRARLEKEGGLARLHAGLRREKAIDFVLSRARIEPA
jgi:trigger factor